MTETGRAAAVAAGQRRRADARDPAVEALLPEARRTIARVGRTFALAARLLPRGIREDVVLLYLVLRTLDDLVDLDASRGDREVRARLAAAGDWGRGRRPGSPTRETRILDDLLARHPALPRDAVADFVAGMRADLAGAAVTTETELDVYCYQVAGTVGRLMGSLLGAEGRDADAAARSLGVAMQRTNILRDIDEDLARGRCYIPAETLAAHGIAGPAELATADRRSLLRDAIGRADAAYDAGLAGIPALRHGRRSILAAAAMYREILRQIERDGLGARRPHRAVVPRWRRATILAGVLVGRHV